MMFSNGIDVTFGGDSDGPAILIQGDPAFKTETNTGVWRKSAEKEGGKSYWRLTKGSKVDRLIPPCPIELKKVLSEALDGLKAELVHPAIADGLHLEANRLFPGMTESAKQEFQSFVSLLDKEFGVNAETVNEGEMASFVDDFGPNLLVMVDDQPEILPELPPIYLAPQNWRDTMWMVTNHMTGPFLFDDVEDKDKVQITDLNLTQDESTAFMEGLFYFQAARFIIIFETWQFNPDAPHLRAFVRLLKAGIRPLAVSMK